MSGHVGDLSEKQESLLEKFRNNVRDVLRPDQVDDDFFLLRWLRARKFDIKKSETMLRNSVAWRQKFGADTLLEDFQVPEVIQKYCTGGITGFDKEGALVKFEPYGRLDMKGLLHSAKRADIVKSKIWELEMMLKMAKENSERTGRRVEQITSIFDMEHLGLRHLWKPGMDVFREVLTLFESNYPEILKLSIGINTPRIFPILFNIIKPLMSEDTINKIKIVGSNYKQVLQQYIDADQIPVYWGGTLTDPDGDPRCVSKVCFGGMVPESYYCGQPEHDASFTDAVVGKGSSLQLDFDITVPSSVIRWQFTTHDFDVGFGIFRRTSDCRQKAGEMVEVWSSERVNSHMVPEDGALRVTEPGTYVVRFDNTFSWSRSKSISYMIEILSPDESDICRQQPENKTAMSPDASSDSLKKRKGSENMYSTINSIRSDINDLRLGD